MRIRSIKPEFWRSPDVADLPREIRLLWIGLWSYVDDNGVGIDDHRIIAAELFALDDPIEAREFVREGLATLSRGLRIVRYTVDGRSYLYVNGWDKHQRIDRPGKARYPLPPADLPPPPEDETPAHSDPTPEPEQGLATPSRHPRETPSTGTGEQGNRGTGARSAPRAPARTRGSTTSIIELADTAVKPTTWSIVNEWRGRQPYELRTQTVRALSKQVDRILDDRGDPEVVQDALDAWARRSDAGPGLLPSLYDDALKARHGARPGGKPTRGDKVNGWLNFTDDDTAFPSSRGDKVAGWLDPALSEPDPSPTGLTAITGGISA